MSQSYLIRISRVYQEGGLKDILGRIARKMAFLLWRHSEVWWYECDLTQPIPALEPGIAVSIETEAVEETWNWIKDSLRNGSLGRIEQEELRVGRLNGHFYPLIQYNGECVGFMKIGMGDIYIGDYRRIFTFPPKSAVIYDSYIDPSLRGKKLAPVAIARVIEVLQQRGYQRMLCNIPSWNEASHKFVTKCGFMRKKLIRFRKILGFEFLSDNPGEV